MCDNQAKGVPRTLQCDLIQCSICKVEYDPNEFDLRNPLPKLMRDRGLCFNCAFWTNKIESPDSNREIVNGEHYVFSKNTSQYFQGSGGRPFYAIHNDGSLIFSNSVWYQGVIPERFREKLPDTAKFVAKKTFLKLQSNPFKCSSKGCWDRYHCYRYDMSIEEKSGPWNTIPKNHIAGQESCESFIDKDKL